MQRAHLFPLLVLTLTAPTAAQIIRGGDYAVPDYSANAVFRVQPDGTATPLHTGAPLQGPSGAAVSGQHEVLVADFTAATLFRINGAGVTPVIGGLRGPLRVLVDRNGDYLVTELTLPGLTRITPAGVRTIIHQGAPFQRPFGVAVDSDGTYLVADDAARALFRVTPGVGVTPLHTGLPLRLPQGVAVLGNGDYAVMDGLADAVFVVPRMGGVVTTLVATPTLGNPCGITDNFDGGVAVSESSATSNRVVRVDPAGALTVVAQGPPFANLEGIGRAPSLTGPVRGQTAQPATFALDLPQRPNHPYLVFASLSLYPGISLGSSDRRITPCNPDGLFFLSIGANNAVFTGFAGTLSATGQANATLTVPVPLPPITFYLQALAVNFMSPNGIAEFTNVHAIAY
jgi:DNA-binding beta-propeller fold protein YncE